MGAGPWLRLMIALCEIGADGGLTTFVSSTVMALGIILTQMTYNPPWSLVVNRPTNRITTRIMSERHDRLRIAFKSTGLTQPQAVERFGFNRNTFKSNLNGNTQYGFEAAKEYARAFNVRAEWLYDGTEPMRPERHVEPVNSSIIIPVISWVAAGELRDMPDLEFHHPVDTVTASDLPPGEWCATTVRGTSMDRMAPEGATIIFNVADKVLLRGRPYLFSNRGEATFKLWEPDPVPHLVPYSTDPVHKPIFVGGDDSWYVIGRVRRSIYDFA